MGKQTGSPTERSAARGEEGAAARAATRTNLEGIVRSDMSRCQEGRSQKDTAVWRGAGVPGVRAGGAEKARSGSSGPLRVLIVWRQVHGPVHVLKFTGLGTEKGQSYGMEIVKV